MHTLGILQFSLLFLEQNFPKQRAVTSRTDPNLPRYPETSWVAENYDRMNMSHHKRFAFEQRRRRPSMPMEKPHAAQNDARGRQHLHRLGQQWLKVTIMVSAHDQYLLHMPSQSREKIGNIPPLQSLS